MRGGIAERSVVAVGETVDGVETRDKRRRASLGLSRLGPTVHCSVAWKISKETVASQKIGSETPVSEIIRATWPTTLSR